MEGTGLGARSRWTRKWNNSGLIAVLARSYGASALALELRYDLMDMSSMGFGHWRNLDEATWTC
jgi:hypothetical protein